MKKNLFLIIFLFVLTQTVQTIATEQFSDGQYTIEVALSGGSGRAHVESPAVLTVNDGVATAIVKWSSPYYEYMLMDGTYYYPINTKGNSTFEIPVSFDTDMAFSAQTVAMSEPHEIDYTLYFDSATLKPLAGSRAMPTPFWAAVVTVIIVLMAVGLLITVYKRRAKQ